METLEVMERISNGEDSFTQFKRGAIPAKELAREFVAFANSEGGIVVFGINDDGTFADLSLEEVEAIGQLVGNTANENVKPPIAPLTQNFTIEGHRIVVVLVPKGVNKPYMTSSGEFYMKSGADKKKISQEELRRLFAESKRLYADEEIIFGSKISDLNSELFYHFLEKDNPVVYESIKRGDMELPRVLENLELLKEGHLTLAGNLIFGLTPQKFTPSFYVDCVYFDGNDVSVDRFIDKKVFKGTFQKLYEDSLAFVVRNLYTKQDRENFNTAGELEVDERVLTELIVNALVHRDYYINASIKIFIFHDRIEIINPGKLTNSLTVDKIISGISIHRNPILNSICKSVLPYSGYGSGIRRVLSIDPDVRFVNDTEKEEFKAIIHRMVDV